jgi:hypothetical protein
LTDNNEVETGKKVIELLVDFSFDKEQREGQHNKVKSKDGLYNLNRFLVDEELNSVEGAELDSVEPGEPVGAATVEKLAVDQKHDDVDKPVEEEVDGDERVVVKLLKLSVVGLDDEGTVGGDEGGRKIQNNLDDEEDNFIFDTDIFLLLLFDPLHL